jgi:hypothetical protein
MNTTTSNYYHNSLKSHKYICREYVISYFFIRSQRMVNVHEHFLDPKTYKIPMYEIPFIFTMYFPHMSKMYINIYHLHIWYSCGV